MQETLYLPSDNSHGVCNFIDFAFWLFALPTWKGRKLAYWLMQWLCLVIDHSGWFESLDDSPFSVPLHKGPKGGSRNLPKRFKAAVVQTSGQGSGFHSGAHVMKVMKNIKKIGGIGPDSKV